MKLIAHIAVFLLRLHVYPWLHFSSFVLHLRLLEHLSFPSDPNDVIEGDKILSVASDVTLAVLYQNWAYDPDICAVSRGICPGYLPTVDIRGICPGIQRRYPGHLAQFLYPGH